MVLEIVAGARPLIHGGAHGGARCVGAAGGEASRR